MKGILEPIFYGLMALAITTWVVGAAVNGCSGLYLAGAVVLCIGSWGLFGLSLKERTKL